jgi:hypothetical protein
MHARMHTYILVRTYVYTYSYIRTYIHTHTYDRSKMVDDENQHVENAFNTLVSIMEKNGNLRKELKNDILQFVSTLRKVFSK